MCLPSIIKTLKQSDDDVRAIAAESLVPVVEHIIGNIPPESIKEFCEILWNILSELDDLSASTSSVMILLSKFYSMAQKYPSLKNLLYSKLLC
jgi:TATA-binding protein-associated factor